MAYVYKHIRLDTGETFYIGIGKYLSRAFSKKQRNNHWYNITNKTDYIVEILEENLSWEEACKKEKEYIKLFGRIDLKTGNLVNKTSGGDGVSGHSDELKNVLRTYNLGKVLTEEHKLKISNTLKGKTLTETHKKNLSKSLSLRKLSDEHKEKISNSMKNKFSGDKNPNYGKKLSESTIEKLREKAKNRKKIECNICGKIIDIGSYKRYHLNKCKNVL